MEKKFTVVSVDLNGNIMSEIKKKGFKYLREQAFIYDSKDIYIKDDTEYVIVNSKKLDDDSYALMFLPVDLYDEKEYSVLKYNFGKFGFMDIEKKGLIYIGSKLFKDGEKDIYKYKKNNKEYVLSSFHHENGTITYGEFTPIDLYLSK